MTSGLFSKSLKPKILIVSMLWITSLYVYTAEKIVKENSDILNEQAKMAEDSQRVVQNALDQILSSLRSEKEAIKRDSGKAKDIVDQYFVPHFDLPFMSMFIVGREWRQIKNDPKKKEEVILAIRGWLTRTYTPAISQYENQTVHILPVNKRDVNVSKKEVIVQSKLLDNGKEYLIKYYLHYSNNTWKVWDISLEGIRLLLNFRSQFKELVSQYKLEGALQKIQPQSSRVVL